VRKGGADTDGGKVRRARAIYSIIGLSWEDRVGRGCATTGGGGGGGGEQGGGNVSGVAFEESKGDGSLGSSRGRGKRRSERGQSEERQGDEGKSEEESEGQRGTRRGDSLYK